MGKPTSDERAAFDRMWTSLEGARIRRSRAPEPEDKLRHLFKANRAGYQTFYIAPARGYSWQCWCVSEYVNAAGYFLMWLKSRKANRAAIMDGKPMAAKDRSVLMRRVEKYQEESWAKERARQMKRKG